MKTYNLPKKMARQAIREAGELLEGQHAMGIFDDGDPNHPMYNNGINYTTGLPVQLFGYDVAEFMANQYK